MEIDTGAMSSLLPKLAELLLEEYNLKESVKKGIGDLKAELESMQGALEKVSSVPLDQLDPLVKIWANEFRGLTYAIEDNLDPFMAHVKGGELTKPTIKNLLKKAHNKCTEFKARHEIGDAIKDIQSQVMKIKERYDRYKINDIVANLAQTVAVASPGSTTIDPRLTTVYNKAYDLAGADGPVDELMKVLSEDVETPQKNLKIVSIVGFGGLGKTTLAKALYGNLSYKYRCACFVRVGHNQGTRKVLTDILLELDTELYKAASTMDERQLINQLQKFLIGKRYFIVIDDLWDIPTWETIKCAFVDSHPESRIIITTRILDVATKAGGIYCMKPLSYDNSKMLLHARTHDVEGVSQDNQPGEVIGKIIKGCGGVPLAIITMASLLADKPRADWSKVYDAIGFGHEDSDVNENTIKIVSFSYYDLPSNLKTCLLYLSMFPKDYFIEKKSLIWRWVIEGFVCDEDGIGSYELGEIYFNKLVNRNLIQFIDHVKLIYFNILADTDQVGCRVHDMVVDFIRTMSSDINFVTVDDMEQHITYSQGNRTSRIHRLSLHTRSGEYNTSIQMEHVRSFNAINYGVRKIPPISSFEVLRVLVIDWFYFLEEGYSYSLEHVRKLVQLRYLGLVKTAVKLPKGIGHDTKLLEILDVRGGLISELPPSAGELTNLRCLWADKGTMMKGKIGKLTRLEELRLYSVDECPNFFTELGNLTNLRVLEIQFDKCEETAGKAMAVSLCNLCKIQSLIVRWIEMDSEEDSYKWEFHVRVGSLEDMSPDSKLSFLSLTGIIIPRVPSWISSLRVPLLSHVWLYVEAVDSQDLHTLGKLPLLFFLGLLSEEEKRISYAFGSDEFQHLGYLVTNIEITLGEEALPRLQSLSYSASVGRKDSLVPWRKGQLPLLENAHCQLDCTNIVWKELKAAEEVMGESEIYIVIERVNYDQFTYAIGFILDGLDRPDGEDTTVDRRSIHRMVKSIQTLLRDDDEPRVGMYGEQELRDIVTRLKSWLHDNGGNDQEELDNSVSINSGGDYRAGDDYNEGDGDDEEVDDDDDEQDGCDRNIEQEEAQNDDATSSVEGRATEQ